MTKTWIRKLLLKELIFSIWGHSLSTQAEKCAYVLSE